MKNYACASGPIIFQMAYKLFIVWNIANSLDISGQIVKELNKPKLQFVGLVVIQIALYAWSFAAGASYTLYSKRGEIVWLFDQLSARNKITHDNGGWSHMLLGFFSESIVLKCLYGEFKKQFF